MAVKKITAKTPPEVMPAETLEEPISVPLTQEDVAAVVAHWRQLYANAPATINYGPPQFNASWNANSTYPLNLYRSSTTHMITYQNGLYILVAEPSGLAPNQDPAWVLVADIGGGGPGGGIVSINGSDEPNQTIVPKAATPITVTSLLGVTTIGINSNSAPTFATKVATDVINSVGFYTGAATLAGTNLAWNATTGKLDASSGMTNPMTTAGDMIVGGTGGVPTRLAKGTVAGQAVTVDSLGVVKYDTITNTKYDFIVTGQNTPTFAAGEEYILYPVAIGEYVEFELTLSAKFKSGATPHGSVAAKFSILNSDRVGYNVATIDLLSLNQSSTVAQNLSNLFTFTAYLTTAPYPINGVTIPAGYVVITIKLNNTLTYTGTTNSIFAKVGSNSLGAYAAMTGSLAPAVLGIVSTPITALTGEEVGATQAIPQDVALFQSTMAPYNFMTNTTTGLTQIKPYYSKYKYVDPINGTNATTSGSFNAPYLTMAYALAQNPTTGLIFVLMGQSAEVAFSIPAASTNIDMIALGTRSALNGFTNKVTVLGTGAGSVRFQGINFGGGLTRDVTSNCGIYVYNGSVGTVGFSQLGNGYTEINSTDASNGANALSAGTIVFYGGKAIAPVITGTGTIVTMDNVGTVIGNGTMAAGGTLYAFETNWVAGATGHAMTSAAGTVTTMQGCNFIRPNGSFASISVSNYDIQNTDFDRANSILGTHVGNYDWYSRLALLNADTITTATKMLVRKSTGEIAEQLIPVFNTPIQFNAPVSSLYSADLTPTPLLLKSTAGSSQTTQMVQLCTSPGSITLDQLFNAAIEVGKTLTYNGRLVVYNALTATNANYYIIIQMLGVVGSSGQLVNLGDAVTTQLSKVQYAYTPVNISGTYTNTGGTAIEAIGIRAQLLYGEANGTALVDTFFLQGTIT